MARGPILDTDRGAEGFQGYQLPFRWGNGQCFPVTVGIPVPVPSFYQLYVSSTFYKYLIEAIANNDLRLV